MTGHSRLELARSTDGHVVRIIGRGTYRDSPAFATFVNRCLSTGEGTVVVDLHGCEYLDSTFLGSLIGFHKRFSEVDPARFLIWADDDTRLRLLATSLLDRVLRFAERCPELQGDPITIDPQHLETRELGLHLLQCHRSLAELGGNDAEKFRSIAERLANELGE